MNADRVLLKNVSLVDAYLDMYQLNPRKKSIVSEDIRDRNSEWCRGDMIEDLHLFVCHG